MKVFISWSGDLSHQVASVWRDWLPSVLQTVVPYVSAEDIDKGARWSTDISKELEGSSFGILCVTPQNVTAPWLNFEAGALSRSFKKSRVSPFLLGLDRKDMPPGPIVQFQSTIFNHGDILKLLKSINDACEPKLSEETLMKVFARSWPELEEELGKLAQEAAKTPRTEVARHSDDLLEEILELTRSQQRLLSSPEDLFPPDYIEFVLDRAGAWRPLSPMVLDNLRRLFAELRDYVLKRTPIELPEELVDLIARLEAPVHYVIEQEYAIRQGWFLPATATYDSGDYRRRLERPSQAAATKPSERRT